MPTHNPRARIGPCKAVCVEHLELARVNADGERRDEAADTQCEHAAVGPDDFGADDYFDDEALPDQQHAAAEPRMRALEVQGTNVAWLREAWQPDRSTAGVRILQMTEAGVVVLMIPRYNSSSHVFGCEVNRQRSGQHVKRTCPFAFLHVQLVECNDGSEFCNMCDNPGCNRGCTERLHFQHVVGAAQQQHRLKADVLAGHDPLCECAQAAISVAFGGSNMAAQSAEHDGPGLWAWCQEELPFSAFLSPTVRRRPMCKLTALA